jgi:hypothetical protein
MLAARRGVMTKWIGTVAVGILGLALAAPASSMAATQVAVQHQPSPQATDPGTRRHDRHYESVRRYEPYQPHYYARPVYYRPYPYGVPYPFVLGFGPWW